MSQDNDKHKLRVKMARTVDNYKNIITDHNLNIEMSDMRSKFKMK